MKSLWLRILLLCTFAYWGTGAAKFLHEMVEHHGGRDDFAAAPDDDDGDIATVLSTLTVHTASTGSPAAIPAKPKPLRHDEVCFICQQLAAMAAEKSAPPVVLAPTLDLVRTLSIPDWHAPVVRVAFICSARAPPTV